MEFRSIETSHHILMPLAYNRVRKIRKPRVRVRSIREQCEIHRIAQQFESPHIVIPRIYEEDKHSYCMDHYVGARRLENSEFKTYPHFAAELIRFFQYMHGNGYWAYGFTILMLDSQTFALIDFSLFGVVSDSLVRFPAMAKVFSLDAALRQYGICFFKNDEPEKIEVACAECMSEHPSSSY